jgi:hypothetical protein
MYEEEEHAMSIVNELEQLAKVANPATHRPPGADPSRAQRAESYRKLGHKWSSHGLARAGLEDSLRGYALVTNQEVPDLANASLRQLRQRLIEDSSEFPEGKDFAHIVQLGEALRIYARDVDFSREKGGLQATVQTMSASMRCFDKALTLLKGQPAKQQAWAYAHRAAARTMGYWLKKTLGDTVGGDVFGAPHADRKIREDGILEDGVFELALQDFGNASGPDTSYAWCTQFQAFLLTIRGMEADFEQARRLLDSTRVEGAPRDSSLERSMSILYFNLMKQRSAEKKVRAEASLEHALVALRADSENFVAAFYAAAALRELAGENAETDPVLDSAIQNARLRAQNSISQANAVLIGLSVLDSSRNAKEARDCQYYLTQAKEHPPDLETRIVFDRALRQLMELPNVSGALQKQLKQFLGTYSSTGNNT